MIERKDSQSDYTPLTPVMADENRLDEPRAALAQAERTLRMVEDLALLGSAGFSNPEATLQEARRLLEEKRAAVATILDKMLNHPEASA